MAIQTLKKTRLQKCLVGCSVEDIDSSVHVVEVKALIHAALCVHLLHSSVLHPV